jgi:hypothetical protein
MYNLRINIQENLMKPTIVCLCGSTKFKDAFQKAVFDESFKGNIVLSVACFTHAENIQLTPEQKATFDTLHFSKVELADEILVLNVGGYIGSSTKNEINLATKLGKTIRYLES